MENNITFPDISLLPILANIFEVTVDELLDVDVHKKECEIKHIFEENEKCKHSGEIDKSINLLKTSFSKYPNNFKIIEQFMQSLLMYYCENDGERKYLLNEVIELGEKILNKCNDKDMTNSTMKELIFVYSQASQLDKAKKLVDDFPSMWSCNEYLLEKICKDEELGIY